MRDILPNDMMKRAYVQRIIEETFQRYGFEPLMTPALELTETLEGKLGPEAEKLFYDARHREGGKEALSLRYDLTVPLARVVAMYPDLPKPFKRYQIAPVWRGERPQRGRYREFWQCDADTVGSASMLADAEIIVMILDVLGRLGFKRFTTIINNRKILKGIGEYVGIPAEQAAGLYRAVDKLGKIGLDGVRRELRAEGIGDAIIAQIMDLLQIQGESHAILDELSRRLGNIPLAVQGIDELRELLAYLDALGLAKDQYRVDFSMVRGLEYYTGPIYETIVDEPKLGSITGGGRYDHLVGIFLGRDIPTTGTSLGFERIIDAMDELGMFPPEVSGTTTVQALVTIFATDFTKESLRLATELRAQGIRTDLALEAGKLGNQIRYAVRKGIPFALILGPDEIAQGVVTLRDLRAETQRTVPRGEVAAAIRSAVEV